MKTQEISVFGSKSSYKDAKLVYLPVPLEATTSYGRGTSKAASDMIGPSHQVDHEDVNFSNIIGMGICTLEEDPFIKNSNEDLVARIDESRDIYSPLQTSDAKAYANEKLAAVHKHVYAIANQLLDDKKYVGLIGGDHSSPFGYIKALSERQSFGILHVDAHFDLRDAYQGFVHSHGSIMYNVREQCPGVSQITHVAIRDFCLEEKAYCENRSNHAVFYDWHIAKSISEGNSFASLCQEILKTLPDHIYISFDIDGLCPSLCPGTGTPVPGGLTYQQFCYLLVAIWQSGKKVVGFDLCEVADPSGNEEWNLNVGSRVLYKLSALLARSQNLL